MCRSLWFVVAAVLGGSFAVAADEKELAEPKTPEPIPRLFVQDLKTDALK